MCGWKSKKQERRVLCLTQIPRNSRFGYLCQTRMTDSLGFARIMAGRWKKNFPFKEESKFVLIYIAIALREKDPDLSFDIFYELLLSLERYRWKLHLFSWITEKRTLHRNHQTPAHVFNNSASDLWEPPRRVLCISMFRLKNIQLMIWKPIKP